MGISCLHWTPGELNRIAESDGPQEPPRRLGSSPAPRHHTSGTSGTPDVPAVGQRGGTQGPGPWWTEAGSECAVHTYLLPLFGRGCMSSLWWCSRTAHCCLLARGRMSGVRSWSVHDSPCPLGTQRQRQPLSVKIFETDYPTGPPPWEGEMHLPSPEAVPSLSGRGGLPTPSSTALLLKAAADAVRDRWWTQGATLGDEQAGRCNRRTGGGSSCRRGRTCWIASVCSCAARNCWAMLPVASPKRPVWDTGTELCRCPYVNQTQPEVALLDHMCGARSGSGSWPPPCMSLSAFSLKNLQ